MKKISQTQLELEEQLRDQLELLRELSKLYDSGKSVAAKSIATTVRVLIHDTAKSQSLLGQLNQKNVGFFDTAGPEEDLLGAGEKSIGSHYGLVGIGIRNRKYIPYLDDAPPGHNKHSQFNEWWNSSVLIDAYGNRFSRREIVLAVANQDGGAHVDPDLDEKYVQLSRKNSMGFEAGINSDLQPLQGVELAVVRQVGHEVLRTLDATYPRKEMASQGSGMILGGINISQGKLAPKPPMDGSAP